MKHGKSLFNIVLCALLAALCCVATLVIQIPTPTGGFLNLGDAIVILGAFLLPPVYGALAAGVGSALADIFVGYAQYAPATFVIKAMMALAVWAVIWLSRRFAEKKYYFVFITAGGVLAEIIMVCGYFGYEALVLRYGWGAAASVVPNMVQGLVGIIAGTILIQLIKATKIKDKLS
ncbi:MAG: ECF transporter S component [Ruminococcus sp.]|nr:ECF transporter S component [Ruminococcus sp.]